MTDVITRDELKAAIEAGSVTVVDALGGSYFEQQHLPGAIPLLEAEVAAKAAAVLPDKQAAIVTYCSNTACANSEHVAAQLTRAGYTNVRRYVEGIQDWTEAGLPVATGSTAAA